MDKIEELRICVQKITKEATKFFEKNIKTSGVRTRKKLQKCKKIAQEIRMLIQKKKKGTHSKKSCCSCCCCCSICRAYSFRKRIKRNQRFNFNT